MNPQSSFARTAPLLGLLALTLLPMPAAWATPIGVTNTTITSSTSSSSFFNDTLLPALRIDTYRTRLLGLLQGDATLYFDQTYAAPFGDATVNAGIAAAMAALTGANAGNPLSFSGPTLDSSLSTLLSSTTLTTQIGVTDTQTITLEDTVGPGTIIIGDRDNGGTAFVVLAGTNNLNVNTHSHFDFFREIQVTDTYDIFDTWRLIGTPVTVGAVPEPGTIPLLALGLAMVMFGRARRHRFRAG